MRVAMAEAKARFADLIRRVEEGEAVVTTWHGRPVAELRAALRLATLPLCGALKGQIWMADDFDTTHEEFAPAMVAPIELE